MKTKTFTLEELCALVEMDKRKIRFYIQKGLVDRPEGTGKGAYCTHRTLTAVDSAQMERSQLVP